MSYENIFKNNVCSIYSGNVLWSNGQGQKQPIKYLFLSKMKARCKPVKGRGQFVAGPRIEPGTLHY
jgi:hypothetical protein